MEVPRPHRLARRELRWVGPRRRVRYNPDVVVESLTFKVASVRLLSAHLQEEEDEQQ